MPYTVTLPCDVRRSVYVLDAEDVIGMIVDHFEVYAHTGAWAICRKKTFCKEWPVLKNSNGYCDSADRRDDV